MSALELVADAPPGPPAVRPTGVMDPGRLLAIAVERGDSLDIVTRLMDLQDRFEASEARRAFVQAMAAFKAEPLTIYKRQLVEFETRDNVVTSYMHADLADVTAVVVPAMARHGLSHRWDVHQQGTQITVDCIVTHLRGHSEKVTMFASPDASGKKNAIQQVASAVTYLQRYTLLAATGMATTGMDDDGRGAGDTEPELTNIGQGSNGATAAGMAAYPSDKFEANLPEWLAAIKAGRTTAAKVIAKVESLGTLTEEQKRRVAAA